MYSDEELMELREKMFNVIGQELKYKELCEAINEPIKSGQGKVKQLTEFNLVARIKKLESPTRYKVMEVYDEALLPVIGRDKFQAQMEIIILSYLRENGYKDTYISNGKLLQEFALISENYTTLVNDDSRRILAMATRNQYTDWDELLECSLRASQILKLWVDRALRKMEKKGVLLYRKGFCLTKKIKNGVTVENVPLQSDNEKRILKCYYQAYSALGYYCSEEDDKLGWVPPQKSYDFKKEFAEHIQEEFGEEYLNAFRANVITISKDAGNRCLKAAKDILNAESVRRIENSKDKSFDRFKIGTKKKMIDEVIRIPAISDYRKIIDSFLLKK